MQRLVHRRLELLDLERPDGRGYRIRTGRCDDRQRRVKLEHDHLGAKRPQLARVDSMPSGRTTVAPKQPAEALINDHPAAIWRFVASRSDQSIADADADALRRSLFVIVVNEFAECAP